MFLIIDIIAIINSLLLVYLVLIFARVLLSWVSPDPYNPIVNFIYTITEPVLSQARRILPPIGGGDRSSPIIVIIVIQLLRSSLSQLIFRLASNY